MQLDALRMTFQLALRNVLRQRARNGITIGAIAFGVAGLMLSAGFIADLFEQLREATIRSQTGHIQIATESFFEASSRSPDQHMMAATDALATRLARNPRIGEVMQRVNFVGLLNNGRTDLPIIGEGVEPDRESRVGSYMMVARGRKLADRDTFGLTLGRGLAHALQLDVGAKVTVVATMADGATNTLDFEVVGVFDTYSRDYDARAVRIHIDAARELIGAKGANLIVLALVKTADTQALAQSLRTELAAEKLDLRTWNQLSDFYEKAVTLYDTQFGVLRWIVLIMVLLGVANSVNLSLFERVGEFATMGALGNRRRDLYGLVAAEAVVLAAGGATLGLILGLVLAAILSWIGIPMPPPPNSELGYVARIQINFVAALSAWIVGLGATLIAFVPAAAKVLRVPIADGLRQNI